MAISGQIVCLLCVLFCFRASLGSDWDIPDILQKPELDKCEGKVANCYCTDHVIDCNGAELLDIKSIYPFISINVSRISITGGRFVEIPDGLFQTRDGQTYDKLTYLDLSNNHIESMGFDAFKYLPRLITLNLSNNKIQMSLCEAKMYDSPFYDLKQLEKLDLHAAFEVFNQDWPCEIGDLFEKTYLPKLKSLDLSGNGFSSYGKLFTKFLCNNSVSLTRLSLGYNRFQRFMVPLCMENLVSLDYRNNSLNFLTAIEMDVIDSFMNLEDITFAGNPFRCDCSFIDTLDWMSTTERPLDLNKIRCSNNSYDMAMVGKQVTAVSLNASEVCEEPRIIICYGPVNIHLARSTFIAIVLASCVLVAAGVAGVILLIRRKRKKNGAVRVPTEGPKIPPYDRLA